MHCQTIFLGAVLALAGSSLSAQAVYRCGSSYSDRPCAGGAELAATPHQPTAAEAAQAARAAATDRERAEAMEKARLAQEKKAPQAIVVATPQPPPPAPLDKRSTAPKKGKLEQFTAVSPGAGKKKGKGK